jgi:hypothetical protein
VSRLSQGDDGNDRTHELERAIVKARRGPAASESSRVGAPSDESAHGARSNWSRLGFAAPPWKKVRNAKFVTSRRRLPPADSMCI